MQITLGDLTDSRITDLLHYHLTTSRAQTAPGSAHALDLKGLQSPDINLLDSVGWRNSYRDGGVEAAFLSTTAR